MNRTLGMYSPSTINWLPFGSSSSSVLTITKCLLICANSFEPASLGFSATENRYIARMRTCLHQSSLCNQPHWFTHEKGFDRASDHRRKPDKDEVNKFQFSYFTDLRSIPFLFMLRSKENHYFTVVTLR